MSLALEHDNRSGTVLDTLEVLYVHKEGVAIVEPGCYHCVHGFPACDGDDSNHHLHTNLVWSTRLLQLAH